MSDKVTGDPQRAFQFLNLNDRGEKPRSTGVTEIRGPYYSVVGPNYLDDVLSTMGHYVDSLTFAGGSFSLMPEEEVQALLNLAHKHDVLVSTGGFMEYVLTQGEDAVRQYIDECARLGFDVIEISAGFITLPTDDWLYLIEAVQEAGLKAKPQVGIQHGAGGDATTIEELEQTDDGQKGTHSTCTKRTKAPRPREACRYRRRGFGKYPDRAKPTAPCTHRAGVESVYVNFFHPYICN